VQKAVDEFNSKIGQALADNLNRNVLAPDSPPAQEASARPAPARTEEGMKKSCFDRHRREWIRRP